MRPVWDNTSTPVATKSNRTNFLKYMHKIDLVQLERRKLLESAAQGGQTTNQALNYFAPAKNLKVLLSEEWFEIHRTDKRYDQRWIEDFVDVLMKSEHRDYLATEWSKDKRKDYIRGCILGLLKEGVSSRVAWIASHVAPMCATTIGRSVDIWVNAVRNLTRSGFSTISGSQRNKVFCD